MTNKEFIDKAIRFGGECSSFSNEGDCYECPIKDGKCSKAQILDRAKKWKKDNIALWNTETKTINGIKYKLEPITEFEAGCDYVWVGDKVPYNESGPVWWIKEMDVLYYGLHKAEDHKRIKANGLSFVLEPWIQNFRKATPVGETVYIPPVGQPQKQKLSDKIDKVRFD